MYISKKKKISETKIKEFTASLFSFSFRLFYAAVHYATFITLIHELLSFYHLYVNLL